MTTEELTPIVRDIDVLLTLGTYQGMSDEEIDIVLQFKIEQALHSEEFQQTISAMQETQRISQQAALQVAQDTRAMLELELSKTPVFELVGEDNV